MRAEGSGEAASDEVALRATDPSMQRCLPEHASPSGARRQTRLCGLVQWKTRSGRRAVSGRTCLPVVVAVSWVRGNKTAQERVSLGLGGCLKAALDQKLGPERRSTGAGAPGPQVAGF